MAIASTVGKEECQRRLAEKPVPRRVLVAQARKLENEQMRQSHVTLVQETERMSHLITDAKTVLEGRRAENRELKRQLGEHFKTPEQLLVELDSRKEAAAHMHVIYDATASVGEEIHSLSKDVRTWQTETHEQIDFLRTASIDMNERKNGHGMLAMRLYSTVLNERKQIWNQIQDLKGSIRVFCRIRPTSETAVAPSALENTVTVLSKGKKRRFEFDKVFGPASTQTEVFEDTKPLVRSVIDGYNVCIFAYGQTGSGKTFTMQGVPTDPGVNTRALTELFEVTEARAKYESFSYELLVSVFEIYNDGVYDLLTEGKRTVLQIYQSPEGMDVSGSQSLPVKSMADVARVLSAGEKNRSTASTDQNAHSSRSHLLLRIRVLGHNLLTGERTFGKLTLVDLAGSERLDRSGASGAVAKETAHINKSLSELGNVIASLQAGAHVPYRNSRLTYLLQDSLGGGDSKTLVFVQVDSQESNVGESIQTLTFGLRVRNVDLGQAKRNTTSSASSSS